MGSDFLKKTKRAIIKHLDGKRVLLGTPDLLTAIPADQGRRWVASLEQNANVTDGTMMMAESQGNAIRLRQGNSYVATLDNPTADIVAKIAAAGAAGARVQRILRLSNKVEVSLC
jgi:hypothetical protein